MRIAILFDARALDGRADEQDALAQADLVERALRNRGHRTSRIAAGLDLEGLGRRLRADCVELVFNLVEAVDGQGRLIHLVPALLDSLGIPYTGVGTEAMVLASHKIWAKRLLDGAGLATPPWLDSRGRVGGEPSFPARYIVKSVWEDASLGLDDDSVVEVASAAELRARILERRDSLGGEAFAEAWVEGREFNLSLLEEASGPRVLPVAEMCFVDFPAHRPRLVGYRAKWEPASFEYEHTVRRFDLPATDRDLVTRLETDARRVWSLLGLSGYARVDFRVDTGGRAWVLEVNPNPCLAADAGFTSAVERAGIAHEALVEILMETALRRRDEAVVPLPQAGPRHASR